MSFETILTICQRCGTTFGKRVSESRARREGRRFCSHICCKAYLSANHEGWFGNGMQSNNKKKTIDEIAPVIFPEEIIEFNNLYREELSAFA